MKHLNYILKSAFIVFLASIFARILGYITKMILARTNQEIYGLYSLGNSIVLFIVPLVLIGLNMGLNRYLSYYKGKDKKDKENIAISTALKIVVPLSFIVFIITFIFSSEISTLFKSDNIGLTLKLFSFLIPITAISYLSYSILTANRKVKQLVISRDIIPGILELILVIIVIATGLTISKLALALILTSLLSLLLLHKYARRLFSFKRKGFDKTLLYFSASALMIFVFSDLMNKIDTIILGHYVSIKEIAIYNVAVPTAQMVLIFSMSLMAVFLQTITEKHTAGKDIRKEYKTVFRWTLILTYPLTLIMVVFSAKIISILFGDKYYLAQIPLSILAFSIFIFALSRPAYNSLLMLNKTKPLILISSLILFTDIILNLILIKIAISNNLPGMYGAAIATGLSFILLSLTTLIYTHKNIRIKLFEKREFKIIVSGIIPLIPLVLIKILSSNESLLRTTVYAVIFFIIYIILLVKLNCFDKTDREIFILAKNKFVK